MDINCPLAQLDRVAWLETKFQAGPKSLILSPGHFVLQTIAWLWPTRAISDYAHDSSERTYSPIIPRECLRLLTNTRFRRRPSRLTGQPFRLASKDPLPGAKIEPAAGDGDDRCASRPITRNAASRVPLQVSVGIVPSDSFGTPPRKRPVLWPCTGYSQASPVRLCWY